VLKRGKRRFEINRGIWMELKLTSFCSGIFIENKNKKHNWPANFQETCLFKIKKFTFFTEYIMNESLSNDGLLPFRTSHK
jgi:hypothetical protein